LKPCKKYMVRWIILLVLFVSNSYAQSGKWEVLAQKSDSAAFSGLLIPEKSGVGFNPYLSRIKEWADNSRISADSLFYLLSHWNAYPKAEKTGIICRYWVQLSDEYRVPYFVYIPEGYNPRHKTALLVYYKGGWLNRSQYPARYEQEIITDNPTFSYLDGYNVIEIFPALKNDLAIYGKYGYAHLQKMVAETKKIFNTDDNKVFLAGFSDGGKSVYNAASFVQTPFACFYPINSFPPSSPAYPNLINRPLFSFTAEKDAITDWRSIKTKAEYVNRIGGKWNFRFMPGKAHFYKPYEKEVLPLLFEYIKVTNRDPLPLKVTYDRSFNDDDFKGVDWLQISVNTQKPPTPYHFSDTVRTYSADGEESVRYYGEKTGQVRATFFDNTFTLITSQTDSVTLYISPLMVDLDRPVKVIINGKILFDEKVSASKSFMAAHFLQNFDRDMIFVNRITVSTPD